MDDGVDHPVGDVRIEDLREPRRDAQEQQIFDMALAMQVDLDPRRLVAAARRRTGLEDFGDPGLLDRLVDRRLEVLEVHQDVGIAQLADLACGELEVVGLHARRGEGGDLDEIAAATVGEILRGIERRDDGHAVVTGVVGAAACREGQCGCGEQDGKDRPVHGNHSHKSPEWLSNQGDLSDGGHLGSAIQEEVSGGSPAIVRAE